MKLSFLWWNTSLSPTGKNRANKRQKEQAQSLINLFIHDMGVDFIALCEVNENDINDISSNCNLNGYQIFNGYQKAGRAYFDTCVLFKTDKMILRDELHITSKKGGKTYKIAQRLDFLARGHEIPLHVFLSHWPSRLHMSQGAPERAHFGIKLREAVEELIELYDNNTALILLGDYNDEPFDHSLSEHLMATRDRHLAKKKKHLLYNPFWRKLGHDDPYTHKVEITIENGGTYFYKSDPISRWKTFDQMIFSSCFLGDSKWHLNETFTQVLDIPMYRELVLNSKELFDHFPIIGTIERVE